MKMQGDRSRSVIELVVALSGLLIWFAHFSALYATQGFVCFVLEEPLGIEGAAAAVRWILAGVSLLALLALLAIFVVDYRRAAAGIADRDPDEHWDFLHYMALAVTGLAIVGVLWTTLAVALVEPCAPTFA
jgi:hypothetical protein